MQKNKLNFLDTLNLSLISAATDLNHADIIFDLSNYGLLSVSGIDAKKLLQGQLTCDVDKLNQGRLGAHCNPQGRIISLFYLFQQNDTYYLLMPSNMLTITIAALKKYAIFYKVTIQDVSEKFLIIGASGNITNDLTNDKIANIHIEATRSIFVGKVDVMQSALSQLASSPLLADANKWKHMNIAAKIPMIYPETSAKFLPHELNLDKLNAVDFDKGCYTGQEIIARMHYRGKLKNHLYLAEIINQPLPVPGINIYAHAETETKAIGSLVDADKENNRCILLLVTDEQHAKNNHLTLDRDNTNFITMINGCYP